MQLTVNVTADDIAQGDIESATRCPIGLAMQRALGHAQIVVDRINLIDQRTGLRACVSRYKKSGNIAEGCPKEAADFQTALMRGERVKPFSFTVKMEKP